MYEDQDQENHNNGGVDSDGLYQVGSYSNAFDQTQEESKAGHNGYENGRGGSSRSQIKKDSVNNRRDAYSDDEDDSNCKSSIIRKVEMLQVNDVDQEFELKSGCLRKKSQDFNRERQYSIAKMVNKDLPERFDQELKANAFQAKRNQRKPSIQ